MIDLSKTAAEYMATGGDTRITIDENSGLNSYGCKPFPYHTIAYSSCTSSNISVSAYSYVESYLSHLRQHAHDIDDAFITKEYEKMRQSIRSFYELHPFIEIAFGSSGTDLELLALAIAFATPHKKVHNIYISGNEVGSGTNDIAKGCYFSELTPLGEQCKIGDAIEGFHPENVTVAQIQVRFAEGDRMDDDQIVAAIEKEILFAKENNSHALIHMVHRTKTGLIAPSWDKLEKMLHAYENDVDVLIDACQGRISIKYVNKYLDAGAMVLLTGSKFFSGPPFSGILLTPENLSKRFLEYGDFPEGLKHFFTRTEFPVNWHGFDNLLANSYNIGLILRLQAALHEMQHIFSINNEKIYKVIELFRNEVYHIIEKSPVFELDSANKIYNDAYEERIANSPFEIDTIITVYLKDLNGNYITFDEAKIVNKQLYTDLSYLDDTKYFLKTIINLGQPVRIMKQDEMWTGTLRFALSSNTITYLADQGEEKIQQLFASEMHVIEEKIKFIIQHLEKFK